MQIRSFLTSIIAKHIVKVTDYITDAVFVIMAVLHNSLKALQKSICYVSKNNGEHVNIFAPGNTRPLSWSYDNK